MLCCNTELLKRFVLSCPDPVGLCLKSLLSYAEDLLRFIIFIFPYMAVAYKMTFQLIFSHLETLTDARGCNMAITKFVEGSVEPVLMLSFLLSCFSDLGVANSGQPMLSIFHKDYTLLTFLTIIVMELLNSAIFTAPLPARGVYPTL